MIFFIIQKFGIKVDTDKKNKIIEGRFSLINEILSKLFDFDNGGIQSGRFQDGNISDIQYATPNDRENSYNSGQDEVVNQSMNASIDMSPLVNKNFNHNNSVMLPSISNKRSKNSSQ